MKKKNSTSKPKKNTAVKKELSNTKLTALSNKPVKNVNLKEGSSSSYKTTLHKIKLKTQLLSNLFKPIITFFTIESIKDEKQLKLPTNKFQDALKIAVNYEKIPVAKFIIIMIVGFISWSLFASIEQFTIAQGRIIPKGKTLIIQHLEGGVIDEIFISEGQKVKSGDTLFKISLGANQRSKEEIEVDLAKLLVKRIRLNAEIEQIPPNYPDNLIEKYSEIIKAEQDNYLSRQDSLYNEKQILKQQVIQQERKVLELTAALNSQTASLKLIRERLDAQEQLLAESLVSNFEYLTTKENVQNLIGRIAELKQSIPAAKSKLNETNLRLNNLQNALKQDAAKTLADIATEIQRMQIVLERFEQQGFRKIIKSPVDGIIKQLLYQSAGGVVQAGEAIVEIVPLSAKLLFEVQLPTSERGKVDINQDALIKVTAYDFFKYGGLNGRVESISADSFINDNGSSFYKVTITTEKNYFGDNPDEYLIEPGMEVIADIKTGRRKVIEYILVPILKLKHNAFRQ